MPRVLTDFNDIDAVGTVTSLKSNIEGSGNVIVGNRVLLYDDGEHEAWGEVTQVRHDLITTEIDWDTWGPAGRYQVVKSGDWNVGMMYAPPPPFAVGVIALGTLNLSATPSASGSAVVPLELQPA